MFSPTDLKTGQIFKENEQPFVVIKYTHTKTARGGATIKIRARNVITGSVIERSFNASETIEPANVSKKNASFLYSDGSKFYFMDPETYAQFEIPTELIGEQSSYLVEGNNVIVLYFEGNPVSIELPNNVILEVTYTEPGFKGNTVTNVYKDATLINNMTVKVPTFVKIGDKVKIDTRTNEYLSRE